MRLVTLKAHPNLVNQAGDDSLINFSTDYSYIKFIDPDITQTTSIYFMSSIISIKDAIFDIFDVSEREIPLYEQKKYMDYVHKSSLSTLINGGFKEYVNIIFRIDSEKNYYKKEGYDLLQYLGDLGGLFDIIFILGSGLTGAISSKLFLAALIG